MADGIRVGPFRPSGPLECRVEERTTELKEVNQQLRRDIAERRRAETALAKYGNRQAAIADFGQIALSEIDLDTLFRKAVMLVRDQLAVGAVGRVVGIWGWRNLRLVQPARAGVVAPAEITP